MLKDAQDLEFQKWTNLFTDDREANETINMLIAELNTELEQQLDHFMTTTIDDKYMHQLNKKTISKIFFKGINKYAVPIAIIKQKWFKDYLKLIESTILAITVGIHLGLNLEKLSVLTNTIIELNVKKSSAQLNRGYVTNVSFQSKNDLETLLVPNEITEIKPEQDCYQIISVVEIYQSLRRNHRYHEPYPPTIIIEFMQGYSDGLIKKQVIQAFINVINVHSN